MKGDVVILDKWRISHEHGWRPVVADPRFGRRSDESWVDRWERVFGVRPKLQANKSSRLLKGSYRVKP